MIRFKYETTLQIVEGFDEETDNITDEVEETFKAGEDVHADVIDDDGDFVDMQFDDGSMAFCVERESFEVV